MVQQVLQLKVLLKGDSMKKFLRIKEKMGLETNAEVIRYLITREYDQIQSSSA
jgi:hypothetical protein